MRRSAAALEQVWVEVPERAVEAYEAALSSACDAVGFFFADEPRGIWRVEGVRDVDAGGAGDAGLLDALAIAAMVTGVTATLGREATEAVRDAVLLRSGVLFGARLATRLREGVRS